MDTLEVIINKAIAAHRRSQHARIESLLAQLLEAGASPEDIGKNFVVCSNGGAWFELTLNWRDWADKQPLYPTLKG